MNMTRYPLEIIVKTRGFYDQHGGKKVCFLTSGMALPAYRYDEGGYCAYVQRNGWNGNGAPLKNNLRTSHEQTSSVQSIR